MFEIYFRSLGINPSVNLLRAFYKLNKKGHWFSFERRSGKDGHKKIFNEFCTSLKHWKDRFFFIDRRAIPDAMPWRHHDSNVADLSPSDVCAEDIRLLCEHVVDLRPVHPDMLYEIGLTTILETPANIFEFMRFLMASGVRIGRGTALRPDEKVVESGDARILEAKEKKKGQDVQNKVTGKRRGTEGPSQCLKKKKTAPVTLDLSSESENLGSQPSDSETHHSLSPINTAPPDAYHVASVVHFEAGGSNQAPQSNENENENDDAVNTAGNEDKEVNSPLSDQNIEITSPRADTQPSGENVNAKANRAGSGERAFVSSSGGSGQNTFPGRNTDGDEVPMSLLVSSLATNAFLGYCFVSWPMALGRIPSVIMLRAIVSSLG
nr:hypothetical protein [Tanacetum cinerariifolium]